MAAFCRFWGTTPAEYWALTIDEANAMTEYANDEISERKRAADRARKRRARRKG